MGLVAGGAVPAKVRKAALNVHFVDLPVELQWRFTHGMTIGAARACGNLMDKKAAAGLVLRRSSLDGRRLGSDMHPAAARSRAAPSLCPCLSKSFAMMAKRSNKIHGRQTFFSDRTNRSWGCFEFG